MKNIVLTGFMCSGKSTIGDAIAKKVGFKFVDSDTYIEEKVNMSVSEIFDKYGECEFRKIEKQCIKEISDMTSVVIATGGGVVLDVENINNLRKNGIVFFLDVSLETILERKGLSVGRPLLDNSTKEDIAEKMAYRKPFYDNNDFRISVDNLSPLQICDLIINSYNIF